MKLKNALEQSTIAILNQPTKTGHTIYTTTNLHMYAEEFNKQGSFIKAYEVIDIRDVVNSDGWRPFGVIINEA